MTLLDRAVEELARTLNTTDPPGYQKCVCGCTALPEKDLIVGAVLLCERCPQ